VKTVDVEDGVCAGLELLPILHRDRMAELLAVELEKQGFKRDGDKATRVDDDGVEITIELSTATVTVKLRAQETVKKEISRTTHVAEERRVGAEEALRESVKKELEQDVQDEKEKLREKVTAQLERKVRDLKLELDRAVNRTTAEALKERASQLGQIQEITEEPNGGMTIKVKL
jgi:hypothetical protein